MSDGRADGTIREERMARGLETRRDMREEHGMAEGKERMR